MKLIDAQVETFLYKNHTTRDSEGHTHPGPEQDAKQTLLRLVTDEGIEGYAFGGASPEVVRQIVRPMLLGEDPMMRERIWQRMKERQRLHLGALNDKVLSAVDQALWDLAGRALNQPVYKLLGGFRDKVPAYASTMCGDDLEGGLKTPEDYARFALACQARGYPAFKLHTWMPPLPGTPDPKQDVAACTAVRKAVGDEMVLMLDSFHYYSREEALYLGKALEELNFYWLEEPMDEHSTSSYVWLAEQLAIPLCGPETAEGKMQTRAEWIVRGASDISRGGVNDLGGITPLVKTAHLCESFGVRMEMHGGGAANLHVLCAMGIPGEFYERGLLHPFLDYEEPQPWLEALADPLDENGYVHVSQKPGLGMEINFDYIQANRCD
jgi:L-alanine-DL-glutamate epimerase-like enolase superfamily enzyme